MSCYRNALTATVSLLALLPAVGKSAEVSIVPVASSGPHSIVGNEISILSGAQTVTLELFLSNWDPQKLRAYQVVIDMNALVSGDAGTALPLGWAREPGDGQCLSRPCDSNADCSPGFTCSSNEWIFDTCSGPDHNPELGAFLDTSRPDYIFLGLQTVHGLDRICYRYGGGLLISGSEVEYAGLPKYVGTLILNVSDDADGTFTVGVVPDETFFVDEPPSEAIPLNSTPALVRLVHPVCGNDTCELGESELNCPADCDIGVPTVSTWGLIIMTLTLAVVGNVYFGRLSKSRGA